MVRIRLVGRMKTPFGREEARRPVGKPLLTQVPLMSRTRRVLHVLGGPGTHPRLAVWNSVGIEGQAGEQADRVLTGSAVLAAHVREVRLETGRNTVAQRH